MSAQISKEDILTRLHQLPSLPCIVQEVIASFSDTNLDTALLSHKIAQDQGLSAKMLRVANSTFYGLPRKVGSIQDAIMVLGFDTVRSMALSAGMVQAFPSTPSCLFDRKSYWERSFRVAAITHALSEEFRHGQQLAYTAGMFHDIGQLIMDLYLPQRFTEILRHQANTGADLRELELSEFGFDHAEIGADLIRLWNFPSEIEQVVRYWHRPELQTSFEPLVCLVHTAELLNSGINGRVLTDRLALTLCGRIRMSWDRIESCLPKPEQLEAAAKLSSS